MTERSRRIEPYFPTQAEVDRICAEARRMRGMVMRRAMVRFWRVLRRSVSLSRKETARTPRHA